MHFLLPPAKLHDALQNLPEWSLSGSVIERWFAFPSFKAAITFAQAVAVVAEQMNHHPDIDIRYRKVRLALTTHDAGGLTELDLMAATRINAL